MCDESLSNVNFLFRVIRSQEEVLN